MLGGVRMSRDIIIKGQKIRGVKNYYPAPLTPLTITTSTNIRFTPDAAWKTMGQSLAVWVKGTTYNTATPLRVWIPNCSVGVQEVTPAQFRAGCMLTWTLNDTKNSDWCVALNTVNGSFQVEQIALMLTEEMEEIDLAHRWEQLYPA